MKCYKLIITILICFSLSGCGIIEKIFGWDDQSIDPPSPCGNGEGYAGMQKPCGNGEGYAGRKLLKTYFWMQPNYKCTDPSGEKISSYRNKIEIYDDGNFVQRGDRCSASVLREAKVSELEISGRLLGYGKGIYQQGN